MTFAGSPDRIEARLVPEAGYEFDPFRISGLPRRPGVAQARAVLLAGRAPAACARILAERQPDVVLGGGGYVAGPMVYAAWRKRIPAALTEADAHLGLANRLAAPFARRVFLAYAVPGRSGAKYRVVGRPVPPVARRFAGGGAGAVRAAGGRPGAARLRRQPGRRSAERGRGRRRWARRGRRCSTSAASATSPGSRAACARPDYRLLPWTDDFGAALAAADLALARAGGSVWEVAAAGTPAVLVPSPNVTADHQTKNARYFERGGRRGRRPRARARAACRASSPSCSPTSARLRGDGRGDARALRSPDAADEIAEELIALAGPELARVGGSGSSGSAAPGSPPTRCWRAPGAPRSAAGTATRRRTSSRCATAGIEVRVSPEPEAPDGWEVFVSSALPGRRGPAARRAPRRARLAAARRSSSPARTGRRRPRR